MSCGMKDGICGLPLVASIGVGSLLVGGAVGYYLSGATSGTPEGTKEEAKEEAIDYHAKFKKTQLLRHDPVEDYVSEYSLREPDVLKELIAATQAGVSGNDLVMICDSVEAQFFRLLLKTMNARKCIEVGSFTGYNTLSMALALPADGLVIACDMSKEFTDIGRPSFERAGVTHKIDIRIAPASETLDSLIQDGKSIGTFDFVFIDADKVGYSGYYEQAMTLLRPGGIIALDNTLWAGMVVGGEESIAKIADAHWREAAFALHRIQKKVHADERVDVSMLKIADGVTLCRKR